MLFGLMSLLLEFKVKTDCTPSSSSMVLAVMLSFPPSSSSMVLAVMLSFPV